MINTPTTCCIQSLDLDSSQKYRSEFLRRQIESLHFLEQSCKLRSEVPIKNNNLIYFFKFVLFTVFLLIEIYASFINFTLLF